MKTLKRCSWLLLALLLHVGSTAVMAQAPGGPSGRLNVLDMPRPIEALDNVWIEELTMLEVRDRIRAGATNALVLTGGIEENGPYLTTGKHNHVLRVMGESIARRYGNTLVTPIVTLEPGNPENVRSPGTVVLSREIYLGVLRDIAASLKSQGFRDIFFMGDSGGNQSAMKQVAEELSAKWRNEAARVHFVPEYYNYDDVVTFQKDVLGVDEDPRLEGLHDDYYITSIIMNDNPRHVRLEQRIKANKASINGISIVPADKTLAHGRRIIDFRTDVTVAAMRKAVAAARPN